MIWGCANAAYFGETRAYRHAVLGDDIEYKGLYQSWIDQGRLVEARIELPEGQVFEDIAPRCADFDGDGAPDPVTVIADAAHGARLALFIRGRSIETPPIGQGNRWLAPFAIADLDGDGAKDIAYVDRPHLAGILRVWSLRDGQLVEIASKSGFSNHRIGEDFITGGVRDCGDGPELVLPNFDWSRTMVVTWADGTLEAVPLARAARPADIDRILNCG